MKVTMKLVLLTLILFSIETSAQSIKNLKPTFGRLVDKSPEGETKFLNDQKECSDLWEKQNAGNKLTGEEKKKLEANCMNEAEPEGYYEILGAACSWYCGGGQDTQAASSALQPFKDINYSAANAHDLSYKTAWIEGVPGYGIGESLTYHFPPENPRITKIIVVNGYVKSKKSWTDNSRVKTLKAYLNDKPFAILNLADTRQEQEFEFSPIGNSDRADWDKLKSAPSWTMKFEIIDIYKGEKYDDTAITEIYFDGIDVH
ncbi:MAG: hypothetical protein ABI663_11000 [Chryseolinea sp.]